jgi:hypothetical protein
VLFDCSSCHGAGKYKEFRATMYHKPAAMCKNCLFFNIQAYMTTVAGKGLLDILTTRLRQMQVENVNLFADAKAVEFYSGQGWELEPQGKRCMAIKKIRRRRTRVKLFAVVELLQVVFLEGQ